MNLPRPIVYYTTAHGYGHSARACDILRALHRNRPEIPVIVVSGVDAEFFSSRLKPGSFTWRHGIFDVGLVQLDSVRADIDATLAEWQQLLPGQARRQKQESTFLEEVGAALVVSDIPALPLAAAQAIGIPGVAVGNFGWNWIYADYLPRNPLWAQIVDPIEQAYIGTDLLLHMPFSEPMEIFPRRRAIPLVAEPGRVRKSWIAERTGAEPGKPWYLLSFSTLDWGDDALRRVAARTDVEFFTILPLTWAPSNIHGLDRREIPFQDVVATVDAVISKPGYGILSECVVNDKPLLYVERTDFIEYPILVEGIQRSLRHIHLPAAQLYQGEFGQVLEAILHEPPPPHPLPGGGADLAADVLAGSWDRS